MINLKTSEAKIEYKNIKIETNRIIDQQYKLKEESYIEDNKDNIRKMWNDAKDRMYENDKIKIEKIYHNNQFVIGSKKVSQELNDYFQNKVKKIKSNIPQQKSDPMIHYRKMVKNPKNKLYLTEINMHQFDLIYSKLKKSSSTIDDGISMSMINMMKEEIKPLLLNLVNSTIRTNKYLKKLKVSKIIPHFKNYNNITDPNNMRPIYIIAVISKIIEKVFSTQIIKYLLENNIVSQSFQGGFKNRSTTHAVLDIHNQLINIMKNNKIGALIALDNSAAYDLVDHIILLKN